MNKRLTVHISAFTTVLLWASGFPFTRLIGDDISSSNLGFIRCILAAIVLLIIGKFTGMRKPFSIKDCGWFFISGIMGFSLYFILFNLSLETLTSSQGSVISSTSPIWTSMIVVLLYKERINRLGWTMIVTAFAGVVLLLFWSSIFGDGGETFSIGSGCLIMFISAVMFAVYNVLNRVFAKKGYTAMEIVTWSAVFGAIQMLMFLPGTIQDVADASLVSNLSALYLGIMPSALAYYSWGKAISMAEQTSEATNYQFINPLLATIIGLIMLHEVPDAGTFIGGAIIIASVIVFSLKGEDA